MFDYINDYSNDIERKVFQRFSLQNASSLDEILYSTYRNIHPEETMELLELNRNTISSFFQLDENLFSNIAEIFSYKNILLEESKLHLLEEGRLLENKEKTEKQLLNKIIARIEQKIAYLANFESQVKVLFYEFFNSTSNIDQTQSNTLNIDLEAGALTLPIGESTKLSVRDIKILTGSNGLPGDVITGKNKLIQRMLENSERIFQYSKLDTGPIQLILEFDLFSEQTINQFILKRNPQFADNNLRITNIVFKDSYENKTNLFKLINRNKQNLDCNSYRLDDGINFYHLPVRAKKIELHLSCNEYVTTNNRKLYSIDLKNIEFYSHKFLPQGQVYFKENRIDDTITAYSARLTESMHPSKEDKSKRIIKKIKFNNSGFEDCSNTSLILNEDKESYAIYYRIERTDKLSNIIINDNQQLSVKTEAKQRSISRLFSPNEIAIDYNKEGFFVFQPKVYRRGKNVRQGTQIGVAHQILNKFSLPLSLNLLKIGLNEVAININNETCEKYVSSRDLIASQGNGFFIEANGETVWIRTDTPGSYQKCFMSLQLLTHSITNTSNEILIEIDENFDPSKNCISIKQIREAQTPNSERRQLINNELLLSELQIDLNAISIYDPTGVLVDTSQYDVLSNELGRGVRIAGIELTENESYTINYASQETVALTDFNFWITTENKIKGIAIDKSQIVFDVYHEEVPEDSLSFDFGKTQILKDSVKIKEDLFADGLLREVPFFNGKHELLNLGYVEKEILPNIEATNGQVVFTTHKLPFIQDEIKMRVMKGAKVITPDVVVDNRIVTLTIDDLSTEGYSISYFFKKKQEEGTYYYSVDYKNGKIFFSEATQVATQIEFSFLNLELEYNIIKPIANIETRDSDILVPAEEFTSANDLVKMVWFSSFDSFNIENLEQYYSPIIYDVKMEMS